ncbi:MAG: UDP-N-acetylglucosamine--N-acetylmuramyl-(pentapeptide) pyrophosphoryl-undecaprenol N-acetylglucosamine transferase [Chloroflexota bacterium]
MNEMDLSPDRDCLTSKPGHNLSAEFVGRQHDDPSLAYIGSSRGLERDLVVRTGIPCFLFPMGAPTSMRAIVLLAVATVRSLAVLRRLRPRVTFATGGYVSIPAVVASWLLRVPVVMFLPDVVPGRAIAWLVPLVRRVAVSTEGAVSHLPPGKAVVTGYPVREFFRRASRKTARQKFNIPDDATVLCVFGGSQGARTINEGLAACLPQLLPDMHVVHIAGEKRMDEVRRATASLDEDSRRNYHLYAYLHDQDMADALAAADLVVCRSGASTVGELPFLGLPAVLVPLPETKVHQQENADFLERHGAAVIISDARLRNELAPTIETLFGDRVRLATMAAASRGMAHPDADARIARLLAEVAG